MENSEFIYINHNANNRKILTEQLTHLINRLQLYEKYETLQVSQTQPINVER